MDKTILLGVHNYHNAFPLPLTTEGEFIVILSKIM